MQSSLKSPFIPAGDSSNGAEIVLPELTKVIQQNQPAHILAKDLLSLELSNTNHLPMTGIILCGGQSKRMGRKKAFLPFAGKTIIEHQLDLMSELFDEVLLVSNSPDDFEHLSASVVKDIIPHRGPVVGLLSGLLVAHYDHALVLACDMPLVDFDLLMFLAVSGLKHNFLAYAHEGVVEPLLGVYAKSCIPMLEELIFEEKNHSEDILRAIQAEQFNYKKQYHGLPPHFSIDTPSDYGKLCESI